MRLQPLKKYVLCFALGCIFSYVTYHMIEGERGLRAWGRLSQQLEENKIQLATLEEQRSQLEKNISLLGNEVDPDLLDQQVRQFLDYSHPRETIIFW